MNFFSIRTNDQNTIGQILNKTKSIVFDRLSWHKDEISIGDIVFIVISGDSSKKIHSYDNGLRAIGKVIILPKDEEGEKHFALEVEIFEFLPETLMKDDFYLYPSLKDAPNIGPETKQAPNQAFRKIDNPIGKAIIKAIIDLTGANNSEYQRLLDGDVSIEKLNLSINTSNSSKNIKKTLIDFIKWYEKPENFKKSYDGLVSYEILNFWDENFFNGNIFNINKENFHKNYIKIENAILDRSNIKWYKFSSATSKGAPEAIMGKNNYLKFLKNNYSNDLPFEFNEEDLVADEFNYKSFHKKTEEAGLLFSEKMVARFVASLCTKPFVICSGLSGSGKTKLAQAFVQWICESEEQYKIIPVGADWTNREPLLGFPNGLEDGKYVKPDSGALDIILKAIEPDNENKPYFLILDEMNLSHVERYFADFLSIMESKGKIKLYSGETHRGIDQEFEWPKNLFIIGTVNIDETTYMFSPKVLDRANVIEFRISEEDLKKYLDSDLVLDMDKFLDGNKAFGLGSNLGELFLSIADSDSKHTIDNKTVVLNFFKELQKAGAEFGYRSTFEINRLIALLNALTKEDATWDGNMVDTDEFIDIAIMQKLLPKLHGSRNKLTRVLPILGGFCVKEHKKEKIKEDYFDKIDEIDFKDDANIIYKLSFEKICRMYKNAIENGYASYAEA